MSWKELIKAYFIFSKKDRIGLLVLVLLVIVAYLLPHFFPEPSPEEPVLLESLAILNDSTATTRQYPGSNQSMAKRNEYNPSAPVFEFDPNRMDAEGWASLGLPDRNVKTLMNYLSKGGKFYQPDDLQKIWGLPEGFYERVAPFIRINEQKPKYTEFEKTPYIKQERTISSIDINFSDSVEFEKLPGIGPKLAGRIMVFRNKLGGFHSIDQVKETYGLADSIFQKIRPQLKLSGDINKLDINLATKEELSSHPYIRWKLANAIIAYRQQHGNFGSLDDLKKIMIINEDIFNKMLPYLKLNR
jgi:competence protein ComEA